MSCDWGKVAWRQPELGKADRTAQRAQKGAYRFDGRPWIVRVRYRSGAQDRSDPL